MSRFNKFWAAIAGNALAIVVGWLAYRNIATCEQDLIVETCTVFGLNYIVLQATLQSVLNSLLVLAGPKNTG